MNCRSDLRQSCRHDDAKQSAEQKHSADSRQNFASRRRNNEQPREQKRRPGEKCRAAREMKGDRGHAGILSSGGIDLVFHVLHGCRPWKGRSD